MNLPALWRRYQQSDIRLYNVFQEFFNLIVSKKPAFYARANSFTSGSNNLSILQFSEVLLDTTGEFNPNSYVWSPSRVGLYSFSVGLPLDNNNLAVNEVVKLVAQVSTPAGMLTLNLHSFKMAGNSTDENRQISFHLFVPQVGASYRFAVTSTISPGLVTGGTSAAQPFKAYIAGHFVEG